MKALLTVVFTVVAVIALIAYYAWAIHLIWNWYMTPFGLPYMPSWRVAVGGLMIVYLCKFPSVDDFRVDARIINWPLLTYAVVLKPLMLLIFAIILHP